MPLYEYACVKCHKHTDAFRSVEERNVCPPCDHCYGPTRKIISLAKPIGDMEPYYDDNLQCGIKSRQHRKQVMREQGVSEKFGTNWRIAASSK
jgi:putative FmdB family regulatory protein